MLLVILGFAIISLIISLNLGEEDLIEFSVIATSIIIIILGALIVFYPYTIEEKLMLYQEENSKIELKVKETVRAYMEYEESTYKKLVENADLTTLLIKYPELNSNELVKVEIETYKENSKEIKYLKEQQIHKSVMAWWLYFGN